MVLSYVSIVHLSFGKVNTRTQLNIQVLYRSFLLLGLP